ncbi:hypothetical protein [Actinoplanes flavus]|uniref:Tetratricopeptide repeat protein n=1 Tax=Actinoplanes flavus TaxID=2820290 RepID=A0ABS3UH81_9ACTN|nr:hypothetical protein [Actinoplanes flavus]MBO3737551.1 hypothetical protein [Actinoplanes flavus]
MDDSRALTLQAIAILRNPGRTPDRAALDTAIDLLRQALAGTPADSPDRAGGLANLSGALHQRFTAFGDPADLDACVDYGQAAGDAAKPGSDAYAISRTNLAASLRLRFDRRQDPADLERAIETGRDAVRATRDDDPRLAVRLANLANGLRTRAEETGDPRDIHESAELAADAYRRCPAGDPSRPAIASNVSMSRYARYRATGDLTDLEAAVAAGRECLALGPGPSVAAAIRLSNTALMLRDLGRHTGSTDRCAEAVTMAERAADLVERVGVEHPANRVSVRQTAGVARLEHFERTGDPADLDAASRWARAAVEAAATLGPSGPVVARAWHHLSNVLQARAEALGDTSGPDGVDAAVRAAETAVAAAHERYPERPALLTTLSAAHRLRYEEHGTAADLDHAVAHARTALRLAGDRIRSRRTALATLGVALQSRFESGAPDGDIAEAVTVLREAATTTSGRANLAAALLRAYTVRRERALLDESIATADRAVAESAAGDRWLPARLNTLAMALRERAERDGSRTDADAAVDRARQATAAAGPSAGQRRPALAGLAVALQTRYTVTAAASDLDDAIQAGWEVLAGLPADHPDRPRYLGNQGSALHERFTARGSAADLAAAVSCLRDAVDATPDNDRDVPGRLGNLSAALREAGDADGAASAARRAAGLVPAGDREAPRFEELLALALEHLGRLDEARRHFAAAITATAAEDRADRRSNQGGLFIRIFDRTGEAAHLDEAVAAAREAARIARPGDPRRLIYRSNLGVALMRRHGETADPADMAEAVANFREVVASTITPTAVRAAAGRGWTMLAADRADWADATTAARHGLELAARAADRGVARSDQERLLAPNQGFASLAAACALNAGDRAEAIELLEAGRAVLLARSLDLRTDLTALAVLNPTLAARLADLRAGLDTPPVSPITPPAV